MTGVQTCALPIWYKLRYRELILHESHYFEILFSMRAHYRDKLFIRISENGTGNIICHTKLQVNDSRGFTIGLAIIFSILTIITYESYDSLFFLTFLIPSVIAIIGSLFYKDLSDNRIRNELEYLEYILDGESESITVNE